MYKQLLLISSKTFPGAVSVLTNLKRVLNSLVEITIMPVEDLFIFRPQIGAYRIEKRIRMIQTDLHLINVDKITEFGDNILFAAWSPFYDLVLNKLNRKGITPSLIVCSTLGQSELSRHELKDYHHILKYLKEGKLKYWLLNRRLYGSLHKITDKSIYFPYPLDLSRFRNIVPEKIDGKNIDLFCLPRLGKNILNQILAFEISNVSASLHINFQDRFINHIIKDINAKVVYHGWMSDVDYYRFIAGMDLSLQSTFTESFSYAVAERMCLGVPPITSYDVYFTAEDKFLSRYLCVKALDTPSEIAKLIKKNMEDDNLRRNLSEKCRVVIEKIANKNNKETQDLIVDLIE